MKLQQLRYLTEIVRRNLNVSAAAARLFTSQPGVSKQIRLLEQELGVELFERRGKQFVGLTAAGRAVLAQAEEILARADNIRRVTQDFAAPQQGAFGIATTHTQAGFVLPPVLSTFHRRYPQVRLNLLQGTPLQLADMAEQEDVDLLVTTDQASLYPRLVLLPVASWRYAVFCPVGHPLTQRAPLTLSAIAEYPLVTYSFAFDGHSALENCFSDAGLNPRLALTAVDTSVLKRYVREGLGVGLMAAAAFDAATDTDLVALEAGTLLPHGRVHVALAPGRFLRGYVYDFIALLAPHLTRDVVDEARALRDPQAIAALIATTAPAAMI
ncbi:MAG TPA: transcriptional regulator CysB [Gammaproteobacteria bacterium]|uniref:LysR substrate-binding domain-containing protein n=1 Tax=Immundisolibacter sp. TaxID=1934948 RepID=UPI000E9FCDF1|nr:transcriptional regulator CysB [Gammaproteobacteria bacterium]HCZ47647.1 transcriptional regulator CysB [Gammaproteobacteria bacterium]MCH77085.1 transcriptional regulator CysB [Gammaproteobacteria bacterium]